MDFVKQVISRLKSNKNINILKDKVKVKEQITVNDMKEHKLENSTETITRPTNNISDINFEVTKCNGKEIQKGNIEAGSKNMNDVKERLGNVMKFDEAQILSKIDLTIDDNTDSETTFHSSFISAKTTSLLDTNSYHLNKNVLIDTKIKEIDKLQEDFASAIPNDIVRKTKDVAKVKNDDDKRALYEKLNIVVEENDLSSDKSDANLEISEETVSDFLNSDIHREQFANQSNEDVNMAGNTPHVNAETKSNCDNNNNHDITAENLILNLNPQEWLNLDEFESIVKDLKSENSCEIFDIEEVIEKHTVHKTAFANISNTTKQEKAIDMKNDDKIDVKEEFNIITATENDVICISSDEETDLKLCISLDDLDILSMSSLEAFSDGEIEANKNTKTTKEKSDHDSITKDKNNNVPSENQTNSLKETRSKTSNVTKEESLETKNVENNDNTIINVTNDGLSDIKDEIIEISIGSPRTLKLVETESDTISISSKGSHCSDYHSSDFEFISEEEAKSDGYIIKYYKKSKTTSDGPCKTVEATSNLGLNCSNSSQNTFTSYNSAGVSIQEPPWNNVASPQFVVDYNYRRNHEIPEGDRYLNLFEDCYAPTTPYMFENKSMGSARNLQYEGLGFDLRLLPRRRESDDKEYQHDADESAKKILNMYPEENRKRRRRF